MLKYASGLVSRACSRAGPACLPLPCCSARCCRCWPAAAAARARLRIAGPRWPLGHARCCRASLGHARCCRVSLGRAGRWAAPAAAGRCRARVPARSRLLHRARVCALLGHLLLLRLRWPAPAAAPLLGRVEPWAAKHVSVSLFPENRNA